MNSDSEKIVKANNNLRIEDLPEYAKRSCKKCYGRGYQKMVKNVGKKQWELDRYDICSCVLKGGRLPELVAKVNKIAKEEEERKQRELLESAMSENIENVDVEVDLELNVEVVDG